MQNSLNDDGIFIAQTGMASSLDDPSSMNTRDKHGHLFKLRLEEAGFEHIREYEDVSFGEDLFVWPWVICIAKVLTFLLIIWELMQAHGGFMGVWSFFVAFESISTKVRWHSNEAEVNLAIKKRARKSKSGKSLFKFFDGATMQTYHYPSRADEVTFCRTVPDAFGCDRGGHGIDPTKKDFPVSDFEVKPSTIENAGRGLFAKVDIPKGSYIAIREQTKDIYVPTESYKLIYQFLKHEIGSDWEFFDPFLYGYGFANWLNVRHEFHLSYGFCPLWALIVSLCKLSL